MDRFSSRAGLSGARRRLGRHLLTPGLVALVTLVTLGGTQLTLAARDTSTGAQPGGPALFNQAAPNVPLGTFEATGLPAGPATGVARRTTVPAGFDLKHTHGGPQYAYVISGSLDIIDAEGNRKTYQAGDFFVERAGEPHTAQSAEGAVIFVVQFLTPGAVATIPAQ